MAELNVDEKKFIVAVLKHQLKKFEKEGKTIAIHPNPNFLAAEHKYDIFLRELIKKLE